GSMSRHWYAANLTGDRLRCSNSSYPAIPCCAATPSRTSEGAGVFHAGRRARSLRVRTAGDACVRRRRGGRRLRVCRDQRLGRAERRESAGCTGRDLAERHAAHGGAAPGVRAFERYVEGGGGWLGFHVSGFGTNAWPWFTEFMGGGRFSANKWPSMPARVNADDLAHPILKGVPATFVAPINEWYSWTPSPRANPDAKVLLTLDGSNFPPGVTNTPNGWTYISSDWVG